MEFESHASMRLDILLPCLVDVVKLYHRFTVRNAT